MTNEQLVNALECVKSVVQNPAHETTPMDLEWCLYLLQGVADELLHRKNEKLEQEQRE